MGAAIGRIPSGLAILTSAHGSRSTGMLASWYQQCSFEPLMITVAVRRPRPVQTLMEASSVFALNLLGEEGAPAMLKHFAKGFALDEDAFAGLAVSASAHGPMLSAALAVLGCSIRTKLALGDHDLYVAEVVDAAGPNAISAEAAASKAVTGAARPAAPYVHVRKTGLSY